MKKKTMLSMIVAVAFLMVSSLGYSQDVGDPGSYPGDDCTLTIFDHGGMIEMCDDGSGTIYSAATPIGGCAGEWDGCEVHIQFPQ